MGLLLVDVSNPRNPIQKAAYKPSGIDVVGVYVDVMPAAGGKEKITAYVACKTGGLHVVEVGALSLRASSIQPISIGGVGATGAVVRSGNEVFVVSGSHLLVLDADKEKLTSNEAGVNLGAGSDFPSIVIRPGAHNVAGSVTVGHQNVIGLNGAALFQRSVAIGTHTHVSFDGGIVIGSVTVHGGDR